MPIKRYLEDGALSTALNYLTLIGNFLFATLLVRQNQVAVYGDYIYINQLQNALPLLGAFGLQVGMLRIHANQASEFLAVARGFLTLNFILVLGAAIIWSTLQADPLLAFSVALASGGSTLLAHLLPVWQWHEHLARAWMALAVQAWLRVGVLLVPFWFGTADQANAWWWIAATSWLACLVIIQRDRLFGQLSFNWFSDLRPASLFRYGNVSLWLSQLAIMLQNRLAILLLPWLGLKAEQIGVFGYVFSLLAGILLLPSMVQLILMRPLIRGRISGTEALRQSYLGFLAVGLIIGAGFRWCLPPILNGLTRLDSEITLELIRGFAPSIPWVFISAVFNLALITAERDRERTGVQLLSALVYAGLLLVAWPLAGYLGLALALSANYLVLALGYFFVSSRHKIWDASRLWPQTLGALILSALLAL